MKILQSILLGGIILLSFAACNNNDSDMDHQSGTHVSAVIKFDHSLAIGDEFSIQQEADGAIQTLVLNKFKFLISDVVVKTTKDDMIEIPNNIAGSLIDLSKGVGKEFKIYLTGIPNGEYKSISFGIGVSDDVANGSADEQSKLFDLAAADMNWSWNPNSYIFSKIEATNKMNITDNLNLHIGKKGEFDGYRRVGIDFPQNITVKAEVSPSFHVKVNLEKLFVPNDGSSVYLGSPSKVAFADNFSDIFEIHHVHPLNEAINLEDIEMDTIHHTEVGNSIHRH